MPRHAALRFHIVCRQERRKSRRGLRYAVGVSTIPCVAVWSRSGLDGFSDSTRGPAWVAMVRFLGSIDRQRAGVASAIVQSIGLAATAANCRPPSRAYRRPRSSAGCWPRTLRFHEALLDSADRLMSRVDTASVLDRLVRLP
jgi:hypothetical protein